MYVMRCMRHHVVHASAQHVLALSGRCLLVVMDNNTLAFILLSLNFFISDIDYFLLDLVIYFQLFPVLVS